MWPKSLEKSLGLDVSHESLEGLKIYHALLVKWQRAINLVSAKTLDDAWRRHFADSAQLERYIPEGSVVADLGSGAGFPGLVLAILRPDLDVHLAESDERKSQFLRTVSRETGAGAHVHVQRIEAGLEGLRPDFVVARALADVSGLLGYVSPLAAENPALECLFLKGAQATAEVAAAAQDYVFDSAFYPSVTEPLAQIVHLRKIVQKPRV